MTVKFEFDKSDKLFGGCTISKIEVKTLRQSSMTESKSFNVTLHSKKKLEFPKEKTTISLIKYDDFGAPKEKHIFEGALFTFCGSSENFETNVIDVYFHAVYDLRKVYCLNCELCEKVYEF